MATIATHLNGIISPFPESIVETRLSKVTNWSAQTLLVNSFLLRCVHGIQIKLCKYLTCSIYNLSEYQGQFQKQKTFYIDQRLRKYYILGRIQAKRGVGEQVWFVPNILLGSRTSRNSRKILQFLPLFKLENNIFST